MKKQNEIEKESFFRKAKSKIKDGFYALDVALHGKIKKKKTNSDSIARENRLDLLFYISVVALPLLQIAIFYFYVNFNSFFLAFQEYNPVTLKYDWAFWKNFDNIRFFVSREKTLLYCVRNSLLAYLVTLFVSLPLALLFSQYIYKKGPAGGFFKVILFIPSIIPEMIMTTMFMFFADSFIPAMADGIFGKEIAGLLTQGNTTMLVTLLCYSVFISFGGNIIMYSSTMSGIDDSLVEAAQLDGATQMQEFWHITIPMIYPTLSTFVTVGVAGIFTHQLSLFSLFGADGGAYNQVWTIGYFLYSKTVYAGSAGYPELAAYGLLMTIVAVPLVFTARYLLAKFGPKTD